MVDVDIHTNTRNPSIPHYSNVLTHKVYGKKEGSHTFKMKLTEDATPF